MFTLGSGPYELVEEEGCARPREPSTQKPSHEHISAGERREPDGDSNSVILHVYMYIQLCPVVFLLYSGDQNHLMNLIFLKPCKFKAMKIPIS